MARSTPNARGLTLIEVLAVVAILVVISAIVLPEVESRLAGARLDAAAGQLDATLIHARAEAQRRGVALRLVARQLKGGTALIFRPIVETDQEPQRAGDGAGPRSDDVFGLLAAGVALADRDPGARKEETPVVAAKRESAKVEPEEVLVATFLPDGSAIAEGPRYLIQGERAYSAVVNQWTGGARVSLMRLGANGEKPGTGASEEPPTGPAEKGAER